MNEDTAKSFGKLSAIVDRLMGDNGCPWDRVQTRESLKPYLVEETYEALEALDSNDPEKIKDELGDLMYQILFHSKISELQDEFSIRDVVDNLSDKMVRRHPHIFEEGELHTPDQVLDQWEVIKKKEKASRHHKSVLDGVPPHLPALASAQKLTKKAAKHGFDWDQVTDVFDKLDEEIAEFKSALLQGKKEEIAGELGDILFVLVNIARHRKIDAEEALRRTNNKFVQRFHHIEHEVEKTGKTLKETPLADLERHWQNAKKK